MKWKLQNDCSAPVITAETHINSRHGGADSRLLPETCVIFEMGMALPFIESNFQTITRYETLPCFLEGSKCILIKDNELHFCL